MTMMAFLCMYVCYLWNFMFICRYISILILSNEKTVSFLGHDLEKLYGENDKRQKTRDNVSTKSKTVHKVIPCHQVAIRKHLEKFKVKVCLQNNFFSCLAWHFK